MLIYGKINSTKLLNVSIFSRVTPSSTRIRNLPCRDRPPGLSAIHNLQMTAQPTTFNTVGDGSQDVPLSPTYKRRGNHSLAPSGREVAFSQENDGGRVRSPTCKRAIRESPLHSRRPTNQRHRQGVDTSSVTEGDTSQNLRSKLAPSQKRGNSP